MTGQSSESARSVHDVLAAHFVMWHDLDNGYGARGEWRCSCGLKFGLSDTAINHVAEQVGAVSERRCVTLPVDIGKRMFAAWIDAGAWGKRGTRAEAEANMQTAAKRVITSGTLNGGES